MRRQDDQAGVVHAHEHHEDEVGGGFVVADIARIAAFFADTSEPVS